MAKARGPLFGLGASGSIADALTYQRGASGPVAKRYSRPANPQTAAQQAQRATVRTATENWHGDGDRPLEAVDQAAYNLRAKLEGRGSGYNWLVGALLKQSAAGQTDLYAVNQLTWGSLSAPTIQSFAFSGALTSADLTVAIGRVPGVAEWVDVLPQWDWQAVGSSITTGLSAGERAYLWAAGTLGDGTLVASGYYEFEAT